MSHPVPGREYGENEYPDKGYHPVNKPKNKAKRGGIVGKLEHMAKRLKGLQETKHFGASRRARHKLAKRIAKGEDIF